jgi:anti-sigma28 factor (negative regulator of flagellin synthesis)
MDIDHHMTDFAPIPSSMNASLGASTASHAAMQASSVASANAARKYAKASEPSRTEDEVDVSDEAAEIAFYMGKLRNLPIRQELVDRVKAEIAKGNYDTPEKLSAAIDEMLADAN